KPNAPVLTGHHQCAGASRNSNAFPRVNVFQCKSDSICPAYDYAVRKETPVLERGVRLMRSRKHRLLQCHARTRLVSELSARTWNTVRVGKMPVSIDYVQRAGELLVERITRVNSHHQIRREVGSPWSRVGEIILGVKRIVPDQTAEDSTLHGESLADRCKIR